MEKIIDVEVSRNAIFMASFEWYDTERTREAFIVIDRFGIIFIRDKGIR